MGIFFSNEAKKFCKRSNPVLKEAILAQARDVAGAPFQGKHLKGKLYCTYRVKFSAPSASQQLVLIYEIADSNINILKIGYRGDIYKG